MAFKTSVQKYQGRIGEVTLGVGEKAVKIGGENTLPFYSFDGEIGNKTAVGMEIIDVAPEGWLDELQTAYKDVYSDTAAWAKFVQDTYAPDFICLRFEGADPNGMDRPAEDCAEIAKKVADAIEIPLVVAGTNNHEKDAKIFEKVAAATDGKNVLLMAATEDNYKAVGAAGGMAYSHKVGAESSVDINLAKQLYILLTQLGVKPENIVMHVGCAAVGYGFEYVSSTFDRIRLAAFGQNDKTLQMPIITPVSFETWNVKESLASEEDEPLWGSREDRGIALEVSTASAVLVSGANAIVLRHPESVKTIRTLVDQLI